MMNYEHFFLFVSSHFLIYPPSSHPFHKFNSRVSLPGIRFQISDLGALRLCFCLTAELPRRFRTTDGYVNAINCESSLEPLRAQLASSILQFDRLWALPIRVWRSLISLKVKMKHPRFVLHLEVLCPLFLLLYPSFCVFFDTFPEAVFEGLRTAFVRDLGGLF